MLDTGTLVLLAEATVFLAEATPVCLRPFALNPPAPMPDSVRVPPSVRVSKDGPVWTVVLHRPERRNAIDPATATALADAFRTFDAADDASVAVLAGEGDHFCAGADLHAIAAGNVHRIDPDPDADGPLGPTRLRLSKPVIAAVEGYAVAGGLELACWCDLRVVAEDAVFGVFCRRVGVPLVDGGTQRLPQIVGLGRALDLILTGRPVDAREAKSIGLATRVVPHGTARASAESLAHDLAALPQTCLRSDRRAVYDGLGTSLREGLAVETRLGKQVLASGEPLDGADRFAEGEGRHGEAMGGPDD
jgi:enoyl-CoA hydratase